MSRNFDGVDDLLRIASNDSVNDLTALTHAYWVNAESFGENSAGRITDKQDGWNSFLNQATYWQIGLQRWDTTDGNWRTPTGTVSLNTWIHLAFTYNYSSVLNDPVMYVNGVSQTVTEQNAPSVIIASDVTDIVIGNNSATTRTFRGNIQHFHVYNRELNFNEIRHIVSRPAAITEGLVAYLPFYGTSSPEPNFTPFPNSASVTGAVKGRNCPTARIFSSRRRGFIHVVLVAGSAFSQSITETITVSETSYKNFIKYLADNFTVTETLFKNTLKYLADNATLTETIYKDFTKYVTDNITVSETHFKNTIKFLSETVTVNDQVYKNFLKYIQENITVSESGSASLVVIGAALLSILTFIQRGMIGQDDKRSMEIDLITTAISKLESDLMKLDSDQLNWDSHE